MADTTKITLSDKELSLVTDTDWILTKHVIIEKVYGLFAQNIPVIRSVLADAGSTLPAEVRSSVPKIYKGENYLQLPYVMLDYPRCFTGQHIFAIRTMFWWGNFFSITLHVSGKYKPATMETLIKNESLYNSRFFIGINEDQWQHHFEESNFIPCMHITKEQQIKLLGENDFIKLALKFDLHQWNNMPALLKEGYDAIAAVLS